MTQTPRPYILIDSPEDMRIAKGKLDAQGIPYKASAYSRLGNAGFSGRITVAGEHTQYVIALAQMLYPDEAE